jgi:hypothetical protein
MKRMALAILCSLAGGLALAKLPPAPADPKAAETAAKAAHSSSVAAFQLCKAMNRTAAYYQADAKKMNKEVKAPTATPDCVDPGPFVVPSAATAAAPAAKKP